MERAALLSVVLAVFVAGCTAPSRPPPTWNQANEGLEAEYAPYLKPGRATLAGQSFLTQRGGGVVKGAGRTVTLDPATTIGNEWWGKTGKLWMYRTLTPPSPGFHKARRTTVADADGRFRFTDLPGGRYYVRTEVTWEAGGIDSTQGGLVGQPVELADGQSKDVVLNQYPE